MVESNELVGATIEVECALKSGREVFSTLEQGRDSVVSDGDQVTITRKPEPGVTEVTTIARDAVGYLRITTKEKSPAEDSQPGLVGQSSYRSLGQTAGARA